MPTDAYLIFYFACLYYFGQYLWDRLHETPKERCTICGRTDCCC